VVAVVGGDERSGGGPITFAKSLPVPRGSTAMGGDGLPHSTVLELLRTFHEGSF
jgi:hypothetical protein